ncbi:UNVERIFIED_CONTAM: hypothetical protein Scaly_2750200 [Sesamum calycinum]|uniref:Uncharacterized protein n=1 Tax=Sesamum calycinum TaxID=2727403 RepID=A0AAW2J0T3_9LAMI
MTESSHDPRLFNQGRQRVVGIMRMQLTMEEMVWSALFHAIDAKTSYNMFLGCPWLHENAVVPSTWHQCFKYCCNDIVKKVLSDNNPFTEAESHFADAKYYIEDAKKENEAFKLLIKTGYNPKEKLSLGKLHSKATGKKLHNATQMMVKEKGHAIQDSRVGLGFTPPKPIRIAIKRVNNNYISEGFSSTKDQKKEENLREYVFNRLGPPQKNIAWNSQ